MYINPTLNPDTFGVFYDYKSTNAINGKDWYLTHRDYGNTHGWVMFAKIAGKHWDHYGNIGVEAGHPTDDNLQWLSYNGKEFPRASQWADLRNGTISVDITYV